MYSTTSRSASPAGPAGETGDTDGRRAELVENTTARTVGIAAARPRISATPRSRPCWPPFHGATSGSTSKTSVRRASSAARANSSARLVTRS
jgi:hypothetical protein